MVRSEPAEQRRSHCGDLHPDGEWDEQHVGQATDRDHASDNPTGPVSIANQSSDQRSGKSSEEQSSDDEKLRTEWGSVE